MMKYSLYPGCSMEGTAVPYLKSIEVVTESLGMHLEEIPDWNCCGATIASGVVGDFTQQVVAARNLALAEPKGYDVLVGCSSCYFSLALTNRRFQTDDHFRQMANEALAAGGLRYNGTLRVRQILEVIINDIGLDKVAARVKRPLTGLKVAGYVGCQTVRAVPWEFDDPENPVFMDKLIEALGATPVHFPMKAKCCGSSQALTATDIVLAAGNDILQCAMDNGARMLITPCPMCQLNLDAYQGMVNQQFGKSFNMPVLFFTQLMAIAFDLPPAAWALKNMIVSPYEALAPFGINR